MLNLKDIEERVSKTTPGDWKHHEHADYSTIDIETTDKGDIAMVGSSVNDAEFIAHSRKDIMDLIRAYKAVCAALEDATEEQRNYRELYLREKARK